MKKANPVWQVILGLKPWENQGLPVERTGTELLGVFSTSLERSKEVESVTLTTEVT
jgi:hypothetical protein